MVWGDILSAGGAILGAVAGADGNSAKEVTNSTGRSSSQEEANKALLEYMSMNEVGTVNTSEALRGSEARDQHINSTGFQNQTNNTVTNMGPWAGQESYIRQALAEAQRGLDTARGQRGADGYTNAERDYLGTANHTAYRAQGMADTATNAATVGLNAAQGYVNNANGIMSRALADPTQATIASAGQYSNNPYLDEVISAASRDIARNLNENELTGINMAAVSSGNVNSSRAGIADAVARRDAADRIGDISAQVRGDAYQQGLALSEQQRQAGLNTAINANNQLGSAYQTGFGGLTTADNLNTSATNAHAGRVQLTQQAPWSDATNYMNLVGGTSFGQTGITSSTGAMSQSDNTVSRGSSIYESTKRGNQATNNTRNGASSSVGSANSSTNTASSGTGSGTTSSGGGLQGALGGALAGGALASTLYNGSW